MLLWDNAPYHVGGDRVVPANVSQIGLLPYSPELNQVENLGLYLRAHHWSNRDYADYEALPEAATGAWRQVCLDPEKVRSICASARSGRAQMTLPIRLTWRPDSL